MQIKTNEEILFEAYLQSIGYDYCGSTVYLKKRWFSSALYIAEINFNQTNAIVVHGHGYPATVTTIAEQIKSIFKKEVELVFKSDEPKKLDYCYYL